MRIGIDARVLDRRITGTGRYLLNILKHLPSIDNKNQYFVFCNSDYDFDMNYFSIIRIKKIKIPLKIYSIFWLNIELPKLLKKYKIDILFEPNVLVPFVNLGATKVVSVIHDVIPWIYKEYYPLFYRVYLNLFIKSTINQCDKIITVSNTSKHDICRLFNVDPNKIFVAHNTISDSFIEKYEQTENNNTNDKYLLYVGAIEKRKNIGVILDVFDELQKSNINLKLLLVGRRGYGSKEFMKKIQSKSDQIQYIEYADDLLLSKLYKNAFAFIFPTNYEGFGIPPLEAMQYGIPVLVSDVEAMKEVVDEAGLCYSPSDIFSFVEGIKKLYTDKLFYLKMSDKAKQQAKYFSISDTINQIVFVFNQLKD